VSTNKSRSYEKKFEVAAPVEAVWKALTDGEELTRWFCLNARCETGVGGKQTVDWGGGAEGTHVIVIWKPNEHLRTEALRQISGKSAPDQPYATDWFLEHKGGVTHVRMVASGFGEGPEWDYEYDGTFHGWDMFHKALKHYLEHHCGQAASNVVIYAMLPVSLSEAWDRLMSPEGFGKDGVPANLAPGSSVRLVTKAGDVLSGVVTSLAPGKTLSAMIENLNKAILNMELTSMPAHGNFFYLSLSTWGLPKADVDALGDRLKSLVYGLFPQKTDDPPAACAVAANEK
jgi:uncharacterized protein YndB with AHSA1/START domain